MDSFQLGQLVGGVLIQTLLGYGVMRWVNPWKRPKAALGGAFLASFLLALMGAAGSRTGPDMAISAWAVTAMLLIPIFFTTLKKTPPGQSTEASEMEQTSSVPAEKVPSLISASYYARHWRGDLPLATSFWLSGVFLVLFLAEGAVRLTVDGVKDQLESVHAHAWLYLFLMLVGTVMYAWMVVGTWRSADKHEARGGSVWISSITKIVLFLWCLGLLARAFQFNIPIAKDMAQILAGNDAIGPYEITLGSDGKAVRVQGFLSAGVSDRFDDVLRNAPGVKTVVLSSLGGRLFEGRVLAGKIRARGLNTFVQDNCQSACTMALLGGIERTAAAQAVIAFHKPQIVGVAGPSPQFLTRTMMEFYQANHVPRWFLEVIEKTPANDMWIPGRKELLKAGVLTREISEAEAGGALSGFANPEAFGARYRTDLMWRRVAQRFPELFQTLNNRAWATVSQGGGQLGLAKVERQAYMDMLALLLKDSSVIHLEKYAINRLQLMKAASKINVNVCSGLINSTLDPLGLLPYPLLLQESDILMQMLNGTPVRGFKYQEQAIREGMNAAKRNLPGSQLSVVAGKASFPVSASLHCYSNINFMQSLLSLPLIQARAALEGLYKGEGL